MPASTTCVKDIVRRKPKRPESDIRRIVIHTAEGALHAADLPPFFRRVEADSHLAIDAAGECRRMVPDDEKAWTQVSYNPGSLSIEFCAFAKWDTRQWVRGFRPGLHRGAQACAHWVLEHEQLHLRRSVSSGVCGHVDLGSAGGGHWDPGPGFPWAYFLALAKLHYYKHRGWDNPRKHPAKYANLLRLRAQINRIERRYA